MKRLSNQFSFVILFALLLNPANLKANTEQYNFDFQLYYWPMDRLTSDGFVHEDNNPSKKKVRFLIGEQSTTPIRLYGNSRSTLMSHRGELPLTLYQAVKNNENGIKAGKALLTIRPPTQTGKYLILLIETSKGLRSMPIKIPQFSSDDEKLILYNLTRKSAAVAVASEKIVLKAGKGKTISVADYQGKTVRFAMAAQTNKGSWEPTLTGKLSRRRRANNAIIFYRTNFLPNTGITYIEINLDRPGSGPINTNS